MRPSRSHLKAPPRASLVAALALALAVAGAAGAQEPAPPPDSAAAAPRALGVTAGFPTDRFVDGATPITLTLSRPLAADEGRLAVLVGATDISALVERSGTAVTYRPHPMRLPSGEREVVVYLVKGAQWTEVARLPIRVSAPGGFTAATADPSVSANLNGQLAQGHSAAVPPPERPTYQDVTLSTGLSSAHSRARGWTLRTQSNFLGASRREQALRWGLLQGDAPRFDLSDYLLQLERGRMQLALGHVSAGSNRHLVNGFASRGAAGTLRAGPASLSLGAMNGSSIVGWDNIAGFDDGDHRVYSATLGLELLPKRPGGIHLDATLLDGSLLPQTSYTQGAVVDAERSRGGGVQLAMSTPSQRLRLAAGLTRSRFDNPERDPQLQGDTSVVPVREETRGARYVEASAGLLQGRRIAGLFSATLTAGYRHERIDPLFRSVAAYAQADRRQHAFDLGGSIGAVAVQLAHGFGNDNLDELPTVLTTNTHTSSAMVSAPVAALVRATRRAGMWPQVTYGFNGSHQYGASIPENSDFSASHVPDQVSRVHDASAAWQAGRWRVQYRFNHSHQDNRQAGRAQSDLIGTANALSLGLTARANIDVSLDASAERQSNRELAQNVRLTRIGGTAIWRATPLTTLTAFLSTSASKDEPATSDADNLEGRLELTRGFDLWRNPGGGGTRGQLFLRYANQSALARQLSALEGISPARSRRDTWTLSSGASLRLF